MKLKLFLLIPVLSMLGLVGPSCAELRMYSPEPGAVYRIAETTILQSKIGPAEDPQITDKRAVRHYLLLVLPDSTYEITFERFELSANFGGHEQNYDYSSLIGRTVQLSIAATGDLKHESGFASLPEIDGFAGITPPEEYRDNLLRLFPRLPASIPGPDRPTRVEDHETLVAWSTQVARQYERTYSTDGSDDSLAIEESNSFIGRGMRAAAFSVVGTGLATYRLEFQSGGMLRSLRVEAKQQGTATIGGDRPTEMPVVMIIETDVRYERLQHRPVVQAIALEHLDHSDLLGSFEAAMAAEDFGKAIKLGQKMIDQYPDRADLHFEYATALARYLAGHPMAWMGKKKTAYLHHLSEALTLEPRFLSPYLELVGFHLNAPAMVGADKDEAWRLGELVKTFDSKNGGLIQARVLIAKGQPDDSRALLKDLLRQHPNDEDILEHLDRLGD